MSDTIVKKIPVEDMINFSKIVTNAYPGWSLHSKEMLKKVNERNINIQENVDYCNFYGAYRNYQLLAGMRTYDFTMNWQCNHQLKVGGVGLVAVDMLHKKEKLAKDLLSYFIKHFKNNGTNVVALYPFRPDFYKKMGFGYGNKKSAYRFTPSALPINQAVGEHIYLSEEDASDMLTCYNSFAGKRHGMFYRNIYEMKQVFKNEKNVVVGMKNDDNLQGYIIFQFKPEEGHFLINDIEIQEIVYTNRESYISLLSFLQKQDDQIRYIHYYTQEESFHYMLTDPRNNTNNLIPSVYHESNRQGVGLMYKIINVRDFFHDLKDYSFNEISCTVRIIIKDSFNKDNEGSIIVAFKKGKPEVLTTNNYDVDISMDISDFSSLIMGAVTFNDLYQNNLANISSFEFLDTINDLFFSKKKPECITSF